LFGITAATASLVVWVFLCTFARADHNPSHLPPVDPILPGSDHSYEDHSGHDHSFEDLHGADFTDGTFRATNFSGANLMDAIFHDAT
jgi:uncharacterized protein YjbI with pentapeptide repeats